MTRTNSSPLLIVGTGSLASLFAARLSAVGIPVTMMGSWQAGLKALEKHGVRLVDADGSERAYSVEVTSDPHICSGTKFALVLVKSWGTPRAAQQLIECLAPVGIAVTLQNGLGNLEILADVLGKDRVALGVTTYGANLVAPGCVRPAGEGTITLTTKPDTSAIGDLLQIAGFKVSYTGDASALIWGKLVINAAINPLTALLNVRNGELLEHPATRELMGRITEETVAVADALGIQLANKDPLAVVEDVARRTAANRSSMLQDVSRGTQSEIDAINGAIVKAGNEVNVPTPVNRTLWQLVKAREHKMMITNQ